MLNLQALRNEELERVLSFFPREAHILELGAGAGWQALMLQGKGHDVQAVDLNDSSYLEHAVFPVMPYDGYSLPFSSGSFDVVFSSNVLEHIQHLDSFNEEISRVLKPHGMAIHIMPTASWRFWTSITHPAWVMRRIYELIQQRFMTSGSLTGASISSKARWYHTIWPNRHGEKGNSLTELYYFSRCAWGKHFTSHGWNLLKVKPLGIVYTGNQLFHNHLNLQIRSMLASIFGSSSCVYVCRGEQSSTRNKSATH